MVAGLVSMLSPACDLNDEEDEEPPTCARIRVERSEGIGERRGHMIMSVKVGLGCVLRVVLRSIG